MRIAICAKEDTESSLIADHFARAEYFVLYDHKTLSFSSIINNAKTESRGAGEKAVKILNQHNIDIVLSPKVGPKALETLQAFKIKSFSFKGAITAKDALYLYFENKLRPIEIP